MNNHLLRFDKNKNYVIFDYETCGLNLASLNNKPWQLAYLVIKNDEIIEKNDFYLKWDSLPISDDAKRITGFKESVYKKRAVDPLRVLEDFDKYLYDDSFYVVGHNIIGFDVYIHNIHRILCGKSSDYSYMDRTIDTNCLARAKKEGIDLNGSDFLSWQYKLQNFRKKGLKTSLKQLCVDYSIDFDEGKLHDALYDIFKNYQVFKKLLWEVEV
ncbi:MAG: exonuclease domain-containing protein [Proteobacteria bacterium]|jgi:DNA polymerase III epsilon subunit-like protein|nr:exonuclease domain-containing protein [Pseudomonadota bacterium]